MVEQKHRVLFVSLEMTPAELFHVALAKFSGIPRQRVAAAVGPDKDQKENQFTWSERGVWESAIKHLFSLEANLRVHGADDLGRSIDDVLYSACRARFDAVFVDHLGMIGRDSGGKELDVLAHAIHRLRGLSRGEVQKGYQPWVVASSQFSREIDKGEEERIPRLSDFRGSARIEHDADVAIGLQKRKGAEDGKSNLDAWVLKNRNGNCPDICMFEANGPTGLITERRKDDAPPAHWSSKDEES
jgi:replicative DNA helicase